MEPHNEFKTTKYTIKKRNKNIKNIPQYNDKGFFNTNSIFLQQKRYDLLFNSKNIVETIQFDNLAEKSLKENKVVDYKFYTNKVDEYSQKQIEWVLQNKKQIKRFFDYTSFDKKNENKAFFTSFSNYLFYPYYKIGNKNQEWFNDFFDLISSFPSLYNFDKRKMNGLIETMRFTDSDEGRLLLENGKNLNPSWSFGGNKWSLWASNVLFDGKSYDNLYIIYPTKDVIYDTGFEERMKGKFDNDDETKECEVFIRKNATPILGGKVFTYTFKDFQK